MQFGFIGCFQLKALFSSHWNLYQKNVITTVPHHQEATVKGLKVTSDCGYSRFLTGF